MARLRICSDRYVCCGASSGCILRLFSWTARILKVTMDFLYNYFGWLFSCLCLSTIVVFVSLCGVLQAALRSFWHSELGLGRYMSLMRFFNRLDIGIAQIIIIIFDANTFVIILSLLSSTLVKDDLWGIFIFIKYTDIDYKLPICLLETTMICSY